MVKIEIVRDLKKKALGDNEYVEAVLAGKRRVMKTERTIVITPELFSRIFSPQRIILLLKVKGAASVSIYRIAKDLGRSYEAVYRDIRFLEGFGLIKVRNADNRKQPYIDEPIKILPFESA
ncbi:HTH domain-containing protein [Candidatus Woesearchaeota archaeon]|nr:HTH domain-containing protein [Candidatus Woesearchaeota archaeon]